MNPLVSIVCLCYNQKKFVREALESVIAQTYANIEVVIADDCSSDGSGEIIEQFVKEYPSVKYFRNDSNIGNCKTFNKAFSLTKGVFIVDFACDDVMLPQRVEEQVKAFEKLDQSFGVLFTNAEDIDESGKVKKLHYQHGYIPPSGDVYSELVKRYFISPPTMMIRREVLEALGGYDESLAYEDFDFWIRSSRKYKYYYLGQVLTKRRMVSTSHSAKFNFRKNNPLIGSTYRVILKAAWLNRNAEEKKALLERLRYEFRHACYVSNEEFSQKFYKLLKDLNGMNMTTQLIWFLARVNFFGPVFYKFFKGIK